MKVQRWEYGVVMVNNYEVAGEYRGAWWPVEKLLTEVRKRTSDEWWIRAYEIIEAETVASTGGPLGAGVDFFAGELGLALDPDEREEIQNVVYEEAATLLEIEIDAHRKKMAQALDWE